MTSKAQDVRGEVYARMSRGYAANAADPPARQGPAETATFRHNQTMEKLVALEQRDPAAFAAIMRDPRQRTAYGYYVESKRAAAEREEAGDA